MNIRTDIAQHLHNQGIGSLGTSLFYSYLPETDTGDYNLTVLDTGGVAPDREIPTDSPTFQVFIRAKDYDTGKSVLNSVYNALDKKRGQLVPGGTYFYSIFAQSNGGHLGRNENDRDEFSINFICYERRS